jgi:molybdopterin converting factor small subunit
MVHVRLGGPMQQAAGGETEFEVEAETIQQLLDRLGEMCPRLKPVLQKGVAVAVDGRVYRGAWQQPVKPDSEVFILPPLQGG